MLTFKKYFLFPSLVTIISIIAVVIFGNLSLLFSVLILIVLEITLSFDNAVVNAKVLDRMDSLWRKRFITWGIWVAVFGTRVVLPVLIVAIASNTNVIEILRLALYSPGEYGKLLDEAHFVIGSFGGVFLMLVALKYFIDDHKEIHWIKYIEKKLKNFASIESIEIILSLSVLLGIGYLVPNHAIEILVSGIIGCILFVLIQGTTSKMESSYGSLARGGFGMFMYLNMLDVAFSLDGVVGAFAVTNKIAIIAIGLGIGAYFVRELTLYIVDQKTLNEIKYLEHGAHWAIFALAMCMLFGLVFHIPETVTGVVGLLFVLASYLNSKYS